MDDEQLLRYNRHIQLPEIDVAGQQVLLAARVLIVGLGGLGCPAAQYLAAAGVGQLVLVDDDTVELVNLQRQVLYGRACVGRPKVEAAREALLRLNDGPSIDAVGRRADQALLGEQVPACKLVLDCSDNIETRRLVNRHCRRAGVGLVSAAAIGWQGQLAVFDPAPGEPCYQCLYPEELADTPLACSEAGVAGPVVGTLGTLQALEAIKLLLGAGRLSRGRLLQFDGLALEWTELAFRRRQGCPVCGDQS